MDSGRPFTSEETCLWTRIDRKRISRSGQEAGRDPLRAHEEAKVTEASRVVKGKSETRMKGRASIPGFLSSESGRPVPVENERRLHQNQLALGTSLAGYVVNHQ